MAETTEENPAIKEAMNLRAYDSLDQPPDMPENEHKAFIPLVIISQFFGLAAVVISVVWMGVYSGGFDWTVPDLVINYHPVFMVLGLVFCFGDAMLLYRVFRKFSKLPVKVVHAIFMLLSLLFGVVGLKSAFDSHNLRNIRNMYSLHSWVGLVVVVLFAMQWLIGLITFLVPSIPMRIRAKIMPLHTSMGLFMFGCSLVACISGITEKNFFSGRYVILEIREMFGNILGLLVMIFGGLVFYLVHRHDYRRQEPVPTEEVSFTSLN